LWGFFVLRSRDKIDSASLAGMISRASIGPRAADRQHLPDDVERSAEQRLSVALPRLRKDADVHRSHLDGF
jgi:hypothetical protein